MIALPRASAGPLAGHIYVCLDGPRFRDFKAEEYADRVGYGMGSKDPHPGSGVVDFMKIDCSGEVRTLLDYAAHNLLIRAGMPDGSFNQIQWFGAVGFKTTDYSNAALSDGFVRAHFHRPGGRGGDPTGHAWLTVNGHTVESYGGHGPGERPWDHPWCVEHVDGSFVVGPLVEEWAAAMASWQM